MFEQNYCFNSVRLKKENVQKKQENKFISLVGFLKIIQGQGRKFTINNKQINDGRIECLSVACLSYSFIPVI